MDKREQHPIKMLINIYIHIYTRSQDGDASNNAKSPVVEFASSESAIRSCFSPADITHTLYLSNFNYFGCWVSGKLNAD